MVRSKLKQPKRKAENEDEEQSSSAEEEYAGRSKNARTTVDFTAAGRKKRKVNYKEVNSDLSSESESSDDEQEKPKPTKSIKIKLSKVKVDKITKPSLPDDDGNSTSNDNDDDQMNSENDTDEPVNAETKLDRKKNSKTKVPEAKRIKILKAESSDEEQSDNEISNSDDASSDSAEKEESKSKRSKTKVSKGYRRKLSKHLSNDEDSQPSNNDLSESDGAFSNEDEKTKKSRKAKRNKEERKKGWEDSVSEGEDDQSDDDIKTKKTSRKAKHNKEERKKGCEDSVSEGGEDDQSDDDKKARPKPKPKGKKRGKGKRGRPKLSAEEKKKSGRRQIKKILKVDQLTEETKDAEEQEKERRKRLEEKQEEIPVVPSAEKFILQKDPVVEVHPQLTGHLKPHQLEGVRFIWDNLIETTERAKTEPGGGAILAHCMGLGKTLQTITFVHTALRNSDVRTVLVVAPLNTLLNWIHEFDHWSVFRQPVKTYNLSENVVRRERLNLLKKWHKEGGVMVMGYDMFRLLASGTRIKYKPWRVKFAELLLDPGPDVIVCDEGHKLKNAETGISAIMSQIKTRRRLVLTGTPLQNNLIEYHCMVNYVKPNLLGSLKEFRNRFVNPICNGQHSDSTTRDVRLMKKRSHVLHEMLRGFVQRKDYTALAQYLCEKQEYIIKVRLSRLQIELYQMYLDMAKNRQRGSDRKDTGMFADYQNFMRIWTHPRVLQLHTIRRDQEMSRFIYSSDDADETDEDNVSDHEEGRKRTRRGGETSEAAAATGGGEDEQAGGMSEKKEENHEHDDEEVSTDEESETTQTEDESDFSVSGDEGKPSTVRNRGAAAAAASSSSSRGASGMARRASLEQNGEGTSGVSGGPSRSERYRLRCDGQEVYKEEEEKEDKSWYASVFAKYDNDMEKVELGGKVAVLFEILRLARQEDDKVLVFSQSLLSLDLIEEMLSLSNLAAISSEQSNDAGFYQVWHKNVDYYRMDGSSLGKNRQKWINEFNDESDRRARLFLISTRAGSLGVNLVAANRVVVFDASWNPSHDIQSIFRVYRFGQKKKCFIYRLIAQGTMEEKIYDRQVTKQSLAFRVVDEQQINRHFTAHDLQELYAFTPATEPASDDDFPVHALPKDKLLADLLSGERTRGSIVSYHAHDSLLDHQEEEELTEEERKAAWAEYEDEKKGRRAPPPTLTMAELQQQYQVRYDQQQQQQQQQQSYTQQSYAFHSMGPIDPAQMSGVGRGADDEGVEVKKLKAIHAGFLVNIVHMPKEKQILIDSIFSMMLKSARSMHQCMCKIRLLQAFTVEKVAEGLKELPMYSQMKPGPLRLIAIEFAARQQHQRVALEKDYKGHKTQLDWLFSRYHKIISDASTQLQNVAASLPPLAAGDSAGDGSHNGGPSMERAQQFARNAFQGLIASEQKFGGANNHAVNGADDSAGADPSSSAAGDDGGGAIVSKVTSIEVVDDDDDADQ